MTPAPRLYTEHRSWVAGSQHPDAIKALKAQAIAEGFDLGPPWLPSDEGVLYGTRQTTTPPRVQRVPSDGLTIRTTPAPGNWAAFWVAALGSVAAIVVALCAVVAR